MTCSHKQVFFRAFSQLLKLRFTAMVTYSFHLYSRSSHYFILWLMNSINWPASSVWVFIAQLGEHCSANAEATGSNPVEAPKIFFSGYFRNCLNCDSLRWSHTHFTNKFPVISVKTVMLGVLQNTPTKQQKYDDTTVQSQYDNNLVRNIRPSLHVYATTYKV